MCQLIETQPTVLFAYCYCAIEVLNFSPNYFYTTIGLDYMTTILQISKVNVNGALRWTKLAIFDLVNDWCQ